MRIRLDEFKSDGKGSLQIRDTGDSRKGSRMGGWKLGVEIVYILRAKGGEFEEKGPGNRVLEGAMDGRASRWPCNYHSLLCWGQLT